MKAGSYEYILICPAVCGGEGGSEDTSQTFWVKYLDLV